MNKERMNAATITRPYGFGTTFAAPYAQALALARAALREQGFGTLTEIDVAATLKEKLGADVRPYMILGACNPTLAHQALQADPSIGLLLPCNVVVFDNGDGTSSVEAMDPEAALGLVGENPAIAAVAHEAGARLRRVMERLAMAGEANTTA